MLNQFGLVPYQTPVCQPGDRYGRLVVMVTGKKPGTYRYVAICQCDCGSEPFPVRIDALRKSDKDSHRKPTRSCGCFHIEQVTKHGLWQHPIYRSWWHMLRRCYNPTNEKWIRYGGRGITVCDRWHDLTNFFEDMAPSYEPGLQIDRIDNDLGYCPDNCRWVDRFGQAHNKSNNINLTLHGETHCLAEWSRITGICYGTLWDRLKVLKWDVEKVLTEPKTSQEVSLERARDASRLKNLIL